MVRLLAFDPCEGPRTDTEESLQVLEDERAEERAIVRAYILDPARDAQVREYSLCHFGRMAMGCGRRYNQLPGYGCI